MYQNATICKILDGSFSSTKWSSQETSKGEIRMMFEGSIPPKMHNTFKEQSLRFIHADATKGWVNGITSNYDKYLLHARTAGVLPAVIGDDKIPRDFMSEFRRDCSSKSANLQEGSQPWNELLNECAGTLENAINEAFDELYWKEIPSFLNGLSIVARKVLNWQDLVQLQCHPGFLWIVP